MADTQSPTSTSSSTPQQQSTTGPSRNGGLDPRLLDARIELKQSDPNSPLHSIKSFEELGLKSTLLQGIHAMKFNKPSRIQEFSLPLIISEPPKNMIAQAQSGTGKTACFVLGMLNRVDESIKQPQAICLCPTRELARQVCAVAQEMGRFTSISVSHVGSQYGSTSDRSSDVSTSQVIIGTPKTVRTMILKRQLPTNAIKMFVVDEAEQMLDLQGLGEETSKILQLLHSPRHGPGRPIQILLFSATFKDQVKDFALRTVPQPNIITVRKEQLSLDEIKQYYINCRDEAHKFKILSDIYGVLTIGQSIIFVGTIENGKDLANRMTQAGHTVSLLYGRDMPSHERDRVIDDFRDGRSKVLITTNLLARGIDILQVSLVINYDVPLDLNKNPDPETYLHRIGRSGRFGRNGIAVTFVSDDLSRRAVHAIAAHFAKEIKEAPADNLQELERILSDYE